MPIRIVPPFSAGNGFAATSEEPSNAVAAASAPGSCGFVSTLAGMGSGYPDIGHDFVPWQNDVPWSLHLEVDDEELDELERALLKARAAELTEVRRRQVRLTAGYGDATTREVLDDEGRRAQLRHDVLTKLLEALRSAR